MPTHPLIAPGLVAAAAAIAAYEVASHLLGSAPRQGPVKRLGPGDAKHISPGGTPSAQTTKPNQLSSPGAQIKQDPSGALQSPGGELHPSGTPAQGGGGSDDDDHGGSPLPNAPADALPSAHSDDDGGGSAPAIPPTGPDDPGADNSSLLSPQSGGSSSSDDSGGGSSDDSGRGSSDDSGGGSSDDSGGGSSSDGGSNDDGGGSDVAGESDDDADVGGGSSLPASLETGVASGATSSLLGDAADAIMGMVSGPLSSGPLIGANAMNPEMQWVKFQWVTLQPSNVDGRDIPPPPQVAASSGAWHRYDGGMSKGLPSHDPRTTVYPGGTVGRLPPLPAPLPRDARVMFKAYPGVPSGMVLFAWRPRTGSTDKINGYWIYGLGAWSVRPPSDVHEDGAPVFDTGMQIPDPPGSVFDSFWTKMFNGSYECVRHEIPGSTEILRSLGVPAGHDGGHWALVHPGYAVWLDWNNTADDFSPPLMSFPIPADVHDPARYPRIRVEIPNAPPPPPYPRFQEDGSVDVNVDVDAPVYSGPSSGPPPMIVGPMDQGPDIWPAGFGPSAPIPPPWSQAVNYQAPTAYAAQLPAAVVPFPPPSIPVQSQAFLDATSAANTTPSPAGEFEQGFAQAIQDDASAASQMPDFAAPPDAGPNYGDPNVQPCSQDVCTLPDGSLGVWCEPCTGWTPYYPGVEFDVPPPDGCPVYADDGSGPDDPPLPVCDLADGTLGVWSPVEQGWTNYFPGCETGAPPPPGAPVY